MTLSPTTIFGVAALGFIIVLIGLGALAWRDAVLLTNPVGYVHPMASKSYPRDPGSAFGAQFENVLLPTPSGLPISGWLVPTGAGADAVVAVHGRGSNRLEWLDLAERMHAAGVSVLLIDLRENGLSGGDGRGITMGVRESEDVAIAARAMKARNYQTVVALGCSLGGAAVLLAGASEPAIAGVVADSAPTDFPTYVADIADRRFGKLGLPSPKPLTRAWGVLVTRIAAARQGISTLPRPLDVISQLGSRPVLLIAGEGDEDVSVSHARRLFSAAPQRKAIWTEPAIGHCGMFNAAPAAYAERVLDTLRQARSGSSP